MDREFGIEIYSISGKVPYIIVCQGIILQSVALPVVTIVTFSETVPLHLVEIEQVIYMGSLKKTSTQIRDIDKMVLASLIKIIFKVAMVPVRRMLTFAVNHW